MTALAVTLREAYALRRTPIGLLFLLAFAMPIGFSTWLALLNNFTVEVANFSGIEIGWLQTVREIPGFFAVGAILLRWARQPRSPRCFRASLDCSSPP